MAKPTKYAPHFCTLFMIIAAVGILLGFIFSKPLITIILLLPAAIYEAYRTEGKSTRAASYILVLILVAEIVLVIFDIEFNLASFLGTEGEYIGGMWVPLGDLRIVGPTVVAVLAVILFTRTRGVYTRWLAGIIFVTCFAIVYLIEPETFKVLLQEAIRLVMRRL
jgi:cbb3-type cytochrome oxidase subunit 3